MSRFDDHNEVHTYSEEHPMLAKGIGFQLCIALVGMVMFFIAHPLTEFLGAIALALSIYLYEVERREWRRHTGAKNAEEVPVAKGARRF